MLSYTFKGFEPVAATPSRPEEGFNGVDETFAGDEAY